jgi:L-ascorbate metabolism protein UlaG (beta-lactamase superfamily)
MVTALQPAELAAMRRILIGVCALFLMTSTASAGEVKIAWYGQSMFLIVTPKGTRIVLDPHNIDGYQVKPLKADLVLMSHLHSDHTRMEVIENAKDVQQFNALKKTGPGGLVVDWNIVDEKIKDVRVQSVPCYHDAKSGLERGKNGMWIIDVDGLRIVHLGDIGHLLNKAQLKKLGTVDVVMVPAGGVYTVNPLDAYKVVDQIKPRRYILPMHYGTIIFDELLPLRTFSDECKENEIPSKTFKGPGDYLKFDTKDPVPAKPTLAVLNYFGEGPTLKKPVKKGK